MILPLPLQTHVRVEDFDQPAARVADTCAGHALADVPIAAPEGGWSAVQRVPEHRASLDRPFGEDNEAAADGAREVEFAVGEHGRCLFAQVKVVGVDPEFLEGDDFVSWGGTGDAQRDFVEAGYSVFGDIFQLGVVLVTLEPEREEEAYTPAVHGEHANGFRGVFFSHCDVFEGRYLVISWVRRGEVIDKVRVSC